MLIPARLKLVIAFAASAIACLAFGGCNASGDISSGQKYAIAVNTYDACVRSMVTASKLGVLEADDYVAWNRDVRVPASAALDRWADALVAKRPFNELDVINTLLDEMVSARVVVERKSPNAPDPRSTGNRTSRGGGVQRHLRGRFKRKRRRSRSDLRRARVPHV